MNFQPELAEKVLRGEKTVTRRLMSDNPRSPWWHGGCSLGVGRDYAVCPGRGKPAVCRVKITSVERRALGAILAADCRREGFINRREFELAWTEINGSWDGSALVWRVAFKLVPESSRTVGHDD